MKLVNMLKILFFTLLLSAFAHANADVKTIKVGTKMTKLEKACVSCHAKANPGIVADWRNSKHAHAKVTCLDCHGVKKDNPMMMKHKIDTNKHPEYKDLGVTEFPMSVAISPKVCARCHSEEFKQFKKSGHTRGYLQMERKSMQDLMHKAEARGHAEYKDAPGMTGCYQCHGSRVVGDPKDNNKPTSGTWPSGGIGNVYADGAIGNCASCHTYHKFSVKEARKPAACTTCHLGPDHPDKEIFENSRHGQIYATEGADYNYDPAPGMWAPGDYRAPTCTVCHMSGVNGVEGTHDVTERLKWNLWAPESKIRNSTKVMSGLLGDGVAGRKKMEKVCNACHSRILIESFFKNGDDMVKLYNEEYFAPSKKMLDELTAKGLIKKNKWADEFFKTFYHLWHHEGRRMRQGALMGGPDYAHWHGVFEVQQDLELMKTIYEKRMKSGKID